MLKGMLGSTPKNLQCITRVECWLRTADRVEITKGYTMLGFEIRNSQSVNRHVEIIMSTPNGLRTVPVDMMGRAWLERIKKGLRRIVPEGGTPNSADEAEAEPAGEAAGTGGAFSTTTTQIL